MEVQVAERRQEAVRVADGERAAVLAVVDLELVVERKRRARDGALEDALFDVFERRGLAVLEPGGDGACRRAERADDDAAVAVRMGAEEGVGIRGLARRELLGVGHASLSNRSRAQRTRIRSPSAHPLEPGGHVQRPLEDLLRDPQVGRVGGLLPRQREVVAAD